jgi:outer membrane protein assembly factor BamB
MMTNDEFLVVASHDGRIQVLDARDGLVRWTQARGHPFAGLALARVGNEVVAASGDGYVCVLALANGTMRWERSLPIAGPVSMPMGGFRVAANRNLVAVQLGGRIFALAIADGHTVWEAKPSPATYQWWLLAAGEEHVYTLQHELVAAGPHMQGSLVQRQLDTPHAAPPSSFITTAFSAWDGTPQWFAHEESAVEPPWDAGSSLVEEDGVVYAYGRQGLHAFEAASGRLLWTCDTVPHHHVGALALGRGYVAIAAGGYFGTHRQDTGTPLWSKTAAKRADGYFEWFDTPLVLGDAVYVGRSMSGPPGFQLESYLGETGALGWVWSSGSATMRPDVAWRYRGAGATLYVPSIDDLWGINAADGSEHWHLTYDFRSGYNALLAIATATS